eukprot:566220-Rhodomonas_salina.2
MAGSGFRVQGLGSKGPGSWIQGPGSRVQVLGSRAVNCEGGARAGVPADQEDMGERVPLARRMFRTPSCWISRIVTPALKHQYPSARFFLPSVTGEKEARSFERFCCFFRCSGSWMCTLYIFVTSLRLVALNTVCTASANVFRCGFKFSEAPDT